MGSIGDAAFFSSKMEGFYLSVAICFGQCWWEISFPSESIPAHSKLGFRMMAQAQWQTSVLPSEIWDRGVFHLQTFLSTMFFRKPSFLTCLCVEEVSRGQKKNYVKEMIKDDTIIHYIYTHTKKKPASVRSRREVQILKRILNEITRQLDSTSRSYLAWFGNTFLNIHISSKNIHWQILEK